MTLGEFLRLMSIGNAPVEVRSAYNGKLLCRNVFRGKHDDILVREVEGFRPEIRSTGGTAHAIAFVYVNGMPELEQEMRKMRGVEEDEE